MLSNDICKVTLAMTMLWSSVFGTYIVQSQGTSKSWDGKCNNISETFLQLMPGLQIMKAKKKQIFYLHLVFKV